MQVNIDYKALGKKVRKYRKEKKWTQSDLAYASQRSNNTVSHIENGTGKFDTQTIVNIANALEVSLDALLCDSLINPGAAYGKEIERLLNDCDTDEQRFLSELLPLIIDTFRRSKYRN